MKTVDQGHSGLSKNRAITILIHVLVWSGFSLAIFYVPIFSGIEIVYGLWFKQFITLGLIVIAFYLNALILVPRFLLRNQSASYFAIIIALVISIVLFNGWGDWVNPERMFNAAFLKKIMHHILGHRGENILQMLTLIMAVLVIGISTSLAMVWKWQKDKRVRQELEKEKIAAELSFLKAQINPHFFFNTLNNIYVLTQVDSVLAGEAIHQLSSMMRYLLYETKQGVTQLSKEIAFVKDYIGLMQLRLTDAVAVSVTLPERMQDLPMASMLVLPFLENAFKHGVSTAQKSYINIAVFQNGTQLNIHLTNLIVIDKGSSIADGSGIGLANTRRRLELLYPGKHLLEICERNAANEYTLHLMIDLS
ncbi:two-component system LytT family sensor kinase [Pedobacter sp. UYP24]